MNVIVQAAAVVTAIGTIGGSAIILDTRHVAKKDFIEFVADYKQNNARGQVVSIVGQLRTIPGVKMQRTRQGIAVDCRRAKERGFCLYLRDQLMDAVKRSK